MRCSLFSSPLRGLPPVPFPIFNSPPLAVIDEQKRPQIGVVPFKLQLT